MSSHHIVKENQEPALIIENIDSIGQLLLDQLLEWSPTIITRQGNLEAIIDKGIKIDILFAEETADLIQDHLITIPLVGEFLESALTYLITNQYKAANILTDCTDILDMLPKYAGRIDVVLLGGGKRLFAVKSGFSKWKTKGELIHWYGNTTAIQTEGLIQQGIDTYLTSGDGFYSVHFTDGYGVIGEAL